MKPRPAPKAKDETVDWTRPGNDDRIKETQLPDQPEETLSDDEYQSASDSDVVADNPGKTKTKHVPRTKPSNDSKTTSNVPDESKKPGVVSRVARKINSAAHANFCRLKIKNKNSKANGRGRFGRR